MEEVVRVMRERAGMFLSHTEILVAIGVFSALAFAGTLAAIPVLLVRLPHDYFMRDHGLSSKEKGRHRGVRLLLRVVRNLAGVVLLAAGLAMLVLPGQGLLTVFISLTLLDFPGKRGMEVSLLRRPGVKKAVDSLRARWGHPPIELPDSA
jgi:hypothetical protein